LKETNIVMLAKKVPKRVVWQKKPDANRSSRSGLDLSLVHAIWSVAGSPAQSTRQPRNFQRGDEGCSSTSATGHGRPSEI